MWHHSMTSWRHVTSQDDVIIQGSIRERCQLGKLLSVTWQNILAYDVTSCDITGWCHDISWHHRMTSNNDSMAKTTMTYMREVLQRWGVFIHAKEFLLYFTRPLPVTLLRMYAYLYGIPAVSHSGCSIQYFAHKHYIETTCHQKTKWLTWWTFLENNKYTVGLYSYSHYVMKFMCMSSVVILHLQQQM